MKKELSDQITKEILKNPKVEADHDTVSQIADLVFDALSKDFKTASMVLIKYMSENKHPHCTAIVTCSSTELLEGSEVHDDIHDYAVD